MSFIPKAFFLHYETVMKPSLCKICYKNSKSGSIRVQIDNVRSKYHNMITICEKCATELGDYIKEDIKNYKNKYHHGIDLDTVYLVTCSKCDNWEEQDGDSPRSHINNFIHHTHMPDDEYVCAECGRKGYGRWLNK